MSNPTDPAARENEIPITEQSNPASASLDQLSAEEIIRLMNAEDYKVVEAVGQVIPHIARAVEAIAERLRHGGRLFYVGAGTSGRLGVLDASECPPTFGVSPDTVQAVIAGGFNAIFSAQEAAEDDEDAGAADLDARALSPSDAVVGLSASGRTPYVIGAIRYARSIGCFTAGISCNPDAPMAAVCDVFICPVVGPEVLAGSTRLKCGTAQKMILNMISTATMVRLGRVKGNLMIGVQPSSEKLRQRAVRIICQLTGASPQEAAEALDACGGDVSAAVRRLQDTVSQ